MILAEHSSLVLRIGAASLVSTLSMLDYAALGPKG